MEKVKQLQWFKWNFCEIIIARDNLPGGAKPAWTKRNERKGTVWLTEKMVIISATFL
jgi:hypothetical protein